MHSRFWTFLAAANIALLIITSGTIYVYKDKASRFSANLFHRNTPDWGVGRKTWNDFYATSFNAEELEEFLPRGLQSVGCTMESSLPICVCLRDAHALNNNQCKEASIHKQNSCFMFARPNFAIEELDRSLNIYALLSALNLWGLLGAVVVWIRMYTCKEDESMPYAVQFLLGIFGAIIQAAVLEPTVSSFATYIALVLIMAFMSYYHRLDKSWWISMYMIQYLFTVPFFVLLTNMATLKRDMLYNIISLIISIVYGLAAFGRAIFDDAKKDNVEFSGSKNAIRVAMIALAGVLVLSAYDNAGAHYLRASSATSFSHGFALMLLIYLLLGLFCHDNFKRICFMDWSVRFLVSVMMVIELGMQ
jgi:hypothetical protein